MPENTAGSVELRDVVFWHIASNNNHLVVLNGISAHFEYGEIVGLVGMNASGKTTLLNVIRGALVPQSGSVYIGGLCISRDSRLYRRPAISIVSQRPDAGLAPSMTVYENYVLSLRPCIVDIRRANLQSLRRQCYALLGRSGIGLEQKMDEQARFLSGGQQQALSVLLALNSEERVLLMDEPTASLDSVAAKQVFTLATEEAERARALVVMVSHRFSDLLECCHRILILRNGVIAREIRPSDVFWSQDTLMQELTIDCSRRTSIPDLI